MEPKNLWNSNSYCWKLPDPKLGNKVEKMVKKEGFQRWDSIDPGSKLQFGGFTCRCTCTGFADRNLILHNVPFLKFRVKQRENIKYVLSFVRPAPNGPEMTCTRFEKTVPPRVCTQLFLSPNKSAWIIFFFALLVKEIFHRRFTKCLTHTPLVIVVANVIHAVIPKVCKWLHYWLCFCHDAREAW